MHPGSVILIDRVLCRGSFLEGFVFPIMCCVVTMSFRHAFTCFLLAAAVRRRHILARDALIIQLMDRLI